MLNLRQCKEITNIKNDVPKSILYSELKKYLDQLTRSVTLLKVEDLESAERIVYSIDKEIKIMDVRKDGPLIIYKLHSQYDLQELLERASKVFDSDNSKMIYSKDFNTNELWDYYEIFLNEKKDNFKTFFNKNKTELLNFTDPNEYSDKSVFLENVIITNFESESAHALNYLYELKLNEYNESVKGNSLDYLPKLFEQINDSYISKEIYWKFIAEFKSNLEIIYYYKSEIERITFNVKNPYEIFSLYKTQPKKIMPIYLGIASSLFSSFGIVLTIIIILYIIRYLKSRYQNV